MRLGFPETSRALLLVRRYSLATAGVTSGWSNRAASLPREEEPQISVPMVDIIVSTDGIRRRML